MIVGAKYLTWAPYVSGGDGSSVSYSGGTAETDRVVRVDMSEDRADAAFYADDHRIDRDNSVIAASLSIEAAQLSSGMRESMLGHLKSSSTYTVTDAAAPYVGVGFALKDRYKGTIKYRAYWYHKVQFGEGQRSYNTKGENLEFQSESLEGEAEAVMLSSAGSWEFYQYNESDTEAAALAWLKGKAGIT